MTLVHPIRTLFQFCHLPLENYQHKVGPCAAFKIGIKEKYDHDWPAIREVKIAGQSSRSEFMSNEFPYSIPLLKNSTASQSLQIFYSIIKLSVICVNLLSRVNARINLKCFTWKLSLKKFLRRKLGSKDFQKCLRPDSKPFREETFNFNRKLLLNNFEHFYKVEKKCFIILDICVII